MTYLLPKVWLPGQMSLSYISHRGLVSVPVAAHNPNLNLVQTCLYLLPLGERQWHMVGSFQGSARHHFKAFTHLHGSRWHLRRLQAFLMPPLQLFSHLLSDITSHQRSLLFKVAKLLQVKWEYLDLPLWSIALSVNLSSVTNGGRALYPALWFL